MKKILIFSTLLALALGLVVAGCATGGGSAPAAPTDTDLVRALGGASKARANGDTVTLTGDVWVEKNLTVPAGITLDLTADGVRLFLKDGGTLTVNGTVNARGHGDQGKGWVDGSICIDHGAATINGSGTINLSGKGRLLNIWGGNGMKKLTLDGVTLVGIKDNNASLVDVVEGGELVLKSGKITGNTRIEGDGSNGGGVFVYNGGTFTMEDGEISGNKSAENGGGVFASGNSTFTMSGGSILGNSASRAGGVSIGGGSTFTMTGGTISGNTAQAERSGEGGGVVLNGGSTFIMESGAISGNTAQGEVGSGGGVYVDNSTFTMKGGVISDNSAVIHGGGVRVINKDSIFIMSGGVISGNTVQDKSIGGTGGGGLEVNRGALFTFNGGTIYGSANTLPAGVDKSLANNAAIGASLSIYATPVVKWGTGGTYTKGGIPQTGGSDIILMPSNSPVGTNDTLIAIPAR